MKYVIIGGDAAGMSAAMEIYRHDESADITTLESGHNYSYGQCGLPYVIDGRVGSTEEVISRTPQVFRDKYNIDARTKHTVTHIDTARQIVYGEMTDTREAFSVQYDRLLIATGANARRQKIDGRLLKGIRSLKTIPDAESIIGEVKNVKHVTLIGGGYISLELVEALTLLGKKVRIILRSGQVASFLDFELAKKIHEEAYKHKVEIIFNEEIIRYVGEEWVQAVQTSKDRYATDFVIEAIGVKPNTDFLQDSGIELADNGAIRVDPHMATTIKYVYAAGDCAMHFNRMKQQADYIPLGTTANKQGRIAGLNMAGINETFAGIVGTSILKFFDVTIGKTGLNEKEVKSLHFDYDLVIKEVTNISSYYPGGEDMLVKLIWKKDSKRLLGMQIIGGAGVDKRIDVGAVALFHRMTLRDMLDLDLSYAPPFNSVWDPLQKIVKQQL
ncbi:FAD-dependent oxidoreductase [Kurthia sibirica]|uniref:CoA-disulfide reductase n=1 Tax=Kurthia sibirica TaxID=202750 RepID=A0A2U3AKL8_9BACL|nr:FAD-dependent oxidoreductase [Kurthia sibirica]PWI25054.1 CoA-disulfide reductase [Kurthia sibirica]GEK34219.1 NADH dehydrogenase [Kurthia sibirica]